MTLDLHQIRPAPNYPPCLVLREHVVKMGEQLAFDFGDPTYSGAVFSADEKYRYALWRIWDSKRPWCAFVMLNPSTATHLELDPTVRKCCEYAKRWGFGGLVVANIFAWRSTDPGVLPDVLDPVGYGNDRYLVDIAQKSPLTIAAWGVHGKLNGRGVEVAKLVAQAIYPRTLYCLKVTNDGHPNHPLYLPMSVQRIPYLSSMSTEIARLVQDSNKGGDDHEAVSRDDNLLRDTESIGATPNWRAGVEREEVADAYPRETHSPGSSALVTKED